MLKKFSEFTNEKKINSTVKSEEIIIDVPKKDIVVEPKKESVNSKDNFVFLGKIVKFPGIIRPSESIIILENKNISKDKLHYIISKPSEDSLVVLKYNEEATMKITTFINQLMEYYKKNEELKSKISNIIVEGNDTFSIIKKIPDTLYQNKKLIQVLNDDIMKLLK